MKKRILSIKNFDNDGNKRDISIFDGMILLERNNTLYGGDIIGEIKVIWDKPIPPREDILYCYRILKNFISFI